MHIHTQIGNDFGTWYINSQTVSLDAQYFIGRTTLQRIRKHFHKRKHRFMQAIEKKIPNLVDRF